MQQTVTCPSCGSPIIENQKFCGVCGLNLAGMIAPKATACPNCGSALAPGQQFCGTCGTKLAVASQQAPLMAQPGTTMPRGTAMAGGVTPVTIGGAPAAKKITTPPKRGILSTAAIVFQILGWIILVGGILISIGIAVFAGMGGAIMSAVPGMGTMEGITAIIMAIIGIVISLLYGLGFLAFAEICYAIRDIEKSIAQLK
jgi:hypothetical protein